MRALLAAHADRAFPVGSVRRENGTVDAAESSVVSRIPATHPALRAAVFPAGHRSGGGTAGEHQRLGHRRRREPGPIQFNAQRGALIRFLARLWADDADLFGSALGRPGLRGRSQSTKITPIRASLTHRVPMCCTARPSMCPGW